MGDLSKNFSRSEFACPCLCGFDTVDIELLNALQECADEFERTKGRPIWVDITSGSRCLAHNARIPGAAERSQHVWGRAADFKLFLREPEGGRGAQIPPEEVADWFELNHTHFGVGRYSNRTHVDSRTDGPARWGSD